MSPPGFLYTSYDDHILYHKTDMNIDNLQEITEVVQADNKCGVKLYFKGAPLPFPNNFVKIVFYVKLA